MRTCRCTAPQTCVKLLSNAFLFAHKHWTRSAQPFARSIKRGVHVRTCRCTPPQTCVKLLSNGFLFTHKIWTQSAQPFARCGRGVCTCARADALHLRHVQSSYLMGPYSHTKFERDPPSRLRDLVNRMCTCARADALHLRHVLSSYPNRSLFTHKIWMRSAQSFARSGKRGVHVRTCRGIPPQTCVKLLSNRFLFTHKIWTQSAQPFARYERGVCTCARADSPHLYIV